MTRRGSSSAAVSMRFRRSPATYHHKPEGPSASAASRSLELTRSTQTRLGGGADQVPHHFGRDVAAAAEVHDQHPGCVDEAPRDAPPAEEERDQDPGQRLDDASFAGAKEVGVGGAL